MRAVVRSSKIATATMERQGPQGPPGASNGATDLTGVIDGNNRTYTTAHAPTALALFLNGLHQSSPGDFTLAGATITMATAPRVGDTLAVFYFY